MDIYVVKEGDTVYSIAEYYNTEAWKIELVNQLQYPYILVVGQALLIPDDTENERTNKMDIYVNGFAYPFISRWVLNRTLPYMSYLSVFSYGFTPDGNLIYPALDDEFMINAAYTYDTMPILTLTPFDENGLFNNNLISNLINNTAAVDKLISNLINIMRDRQFHAVDIDFEYIKADDRDVFTGFVRKVTESLNEYGYEVFVDLAPKTSDTQPGLLYEGKDYGGLGAAANAVLLMTYEWGYAYGPPMAVAPINQVKRVVEYALTKIPADKVSLGIPNYGYDWTLPYSVGGMRARTIGNIEAVTIARDNNAIIEYDEEAQSPYFYYFKNNIRHVVWYEDVRSLSAKFELIREYGLRGAGYWTIMQWYDANYELLSSYFNIIKG